MMKPILAFKCLAAAGLILAAAAMSRPSLQKQPTEPIRDICEEVAHELNLAYQDGRFGRDEAIRIIDRCFNTFS